MSSAAPRNIFEENIPGYRDVKKRVVEISKGNKKEIMRTGKEIALAQTAGAMVASAPTAIASGSLGALFTNTLVQPLLLANPGTIFIGGAAALGAAGIGYMAYKRKRWVDEMRKSGKTDKDILAADMKNVISAPVQPTARALWGGVGLGVNIINSVMIEGGKLDQGLDKVAERGKGTYQGEILETVDSGLKLVERITKFNPANAFIPPKERKKAADKGEGGDAKKAA